MRNISLFFVLWFMEGVFSETVSVNEGGSKTLSPQLTEIKKDDVIDWRFGGILIARVRNNNKPSVYEDEVDGKFRGRLQLDGQTGDLNITNIRKTDDGVYELSNSINTIKKSFNISVRGVFNETKSVSVNEGDLVTLSPELTEIKKDDVMDWRFGGNLIARVRNNNNPSVYNDELDGKFRGRLKLNGQTGDLNITNIRKDDAGVYELSNSINTFKKTFNVSVTGVFSGTELVSVKVGDSKTLSHQLTELKKNDVIDWRFGGKLLATVRINNNTSVYEHEHGGKFRGRLKLDVQTGDLNITDIRTTHAGVYEVSNSINTIKKTFSVSVRGASSGAVTVIVSVVVLLVAAAAALIITG